MRFACSDQRFDRVHDGAIYGNRTQLALHLLSGCVLGGEGEGEKGLRKETIVFIVRAVTVKL